MSSMSSRYGFGSVKCSTVNQLIAKLNKENTEAIEYLKTDVFPNNKFLEHLLSDLSGITLYIHMMGTALDDDFNKVFGDDKLIAYSPNLNGNILLPLAFPRITHEIGHMVEINDVKRIFKNDWGQKRLGKYPKPSSKFAALAREQRVYTLEKIMGLDTKNYPHELRNHHQSGWNMTSDKFKTQKETDAWLYRIVAKTRADWNRDRIEHEWFKRINMLREANASTVKIAALRFIEKDKGILQWISRVFVMVRLRLTRRVAPMVFVLFLVNLRPFNFFLLRSL